MQNLRPLVCFALCAGLAGCIDSRPPAAGQVFAGPSELILREDINPKSKPTGTVHHGDRLDVLQQRRRMYKVRAATGVQGWTDERNLMSVDRMQALSQLEEQARRWPSQGAATTFDLLNVHTEAQRFSPSFLQIKPGENFDIIAHQTAPRTEPRHAALVKPQPRVEPSHKTSAKPRRTPPPPEPPAPKPPPDWVDLSEQRQPAPTPLPELKTPTKQVEKEPTPEDDWTLIRTSSGAAGWVLTSRIFLTIPDEVAQYAEGHRIVTYFSLGHVHDADKDADKETWLWTTVRAGKHPYDFDNVRVFEWNPHRHRYETAYIHKNVEGFMPIVVRKLDGETTFSVCLNDDDGNRHGYTYSLIENRVHAAGVGECAKPETATDLKGPPVIAVPKPPESFSQKLKEKASEMKRKLIGK
jgi:hypothetical protein